jgi:hypothetical protein
VRVFKRMPRHVQEYLQELYTTCDVCGSKTRGGAYDGTEITIEARIGDVYPEAEGDMRQVAIADICAACFRDRVKPALVSIGVRFREFRGEGHGDEPKIVDGKVEQS